MPGIYLPMLTQDKGWLYLEYCEDGSRKGIEIRGWCFILEIESREEQDIKTRAVRGTRNSPAVS